jgi:S1-C subfamily serine protease
MTLRSAGSIAAVLALFLTASASAQDLSARQIAQGTFPSTVLLLMQDSDGQPSVLGSGFFVRDNLVATNFHVIRGSAKGYAKLVGQTSRFPIAGVAGIDEDRDLALLAVNAKAPPLRLAEKEPVEIGDEIYAVGNPEGLEGTFSHGLVSGVRRINADTILQITAPISPGSSGGPVLNSKG